MLSGGRYLSFCEHFLTNFLPNFAAPENFLAVVISIDLLLLPNNFTNLTALELIHFAISCHQLLTEFVIAIQ